VHWLGPLGALVCALSALALPAPAAAAESGNCSAEKALVAFVAENTPLSPATGAEAQQGSAVTFSFEHELEATTMRFEAASSEALLSRPDIDSGTATAQPAKFTFTSTNATAQPRTVFWSFSFAHTLKACGGETVTYTTHVRRLEVKGTGSSGSSGESSAVSPPTQSPAHLRVGITAPRVLHVGRPVVSYTVSCTAQCTGSTSVKAWLVPRHKKALRTRLLDFGPRSVSIKGSSGGRERFTERLHGHGLAKLRSVFHTRGEGRLVVSVTVKDSSGKVAQISRTILLRR
jgi:hypothetical protein